MKEYYLECKKFLFNRRILILAIVLILVNAVKLLYFTYYDVTITQRAALKRNEQYQKNLKQYETDMSEKTARKVIKGAKNYEDFLLAGGGEKENIQDYTAYQIRDLYEYQYNYHKTSQQIVEKANENIVFYESKNNIREENRNRFASWIYAGRYIKKFVDCEDFSELFQYHFSTGMLLLFTVVLSFSFFFQEKTVGTYQILLTCGKRRAKILNLKILCTSSFLIGMATALWATDVAVYSVKLHLTGWLQPVYAISSYQHSCFRGTILNYYLLERFLCILAMEAVLWFCACLTCLCKREKTAVLLIILGVGFLYYFGDVLFVPENYFQTNRIGMFCTLPICRWEIYIAGAVIAAVLGFCAVRRAFR